MNNVYCHTTGIALYDSVWAFPSVVKCTDKSRFIHSHKKVVAVLRNMKIEVCLPDEKEVYKGCFQMPEKLFLERIKF